MGTLGVHLRSNFVGYVALLVALAGVPTAWALANNTVGSQQLKPNAVNRSDIAPDAVNSARVADATLFRRDLANAAVGSAQLADGSVVAAKLGPQLLAQAGAVSNQSIPNNTETTVVIDEPEDARGTFDVGGLYDPASPSKFTVGRAGIYRVTGHLFWTPNAAGFRELRIQQDFASGGLTNSPVARSDAGAASLVQNGSLLFEAAPGDAFRLRVRQTSGAALNLNLIAASVEWLGPAG